MNPYRRDAAEAAAAAGEQPGKAVAGEKRKAAAEPADAEEHLSFGKIEMDSGALPYPGSRATPWDSKNFGILSCSLDY